MKPQQQNLYKVISCDNLNITLQILNKATLFNISWSEFFIVDYLCYIPKKQLFYLGSFYTQNMRNVDLQAKLSRDSETIDMKKMILSEMRGGNYLMLDIKTNKLETVHLKFIIANLQLLEDFTSLQCFFLGLRSGLFFKANNINKKDTF